MLKYLTIATSILLFPASGMAKPYINIEHNASYLHQCSKCGSKNIGSITELHIGYRGELIEGVSYYFQGGPAIVRESGYEDERESSAKAGIDISLNENLDIYSEIWTISDGIGYDGSQFTSKIGVTMSF